MGGLEHIKANLEEKGLTLEEAKANFEGKLNEFASTNGVSIEEAKAKISEMRANGKTFEGMKNIKDIISNIPTE